MGDKPCMHDVRVDNATADKAESDADTIEMWDRTPRLIVVDNDNGGAGGASTLPANQAKMFSLEERDNRNVVLRSLANCSEFMRNRQIPILVATCSLLFTIGALLLGPPEMKSHYRWYLTPFLAVVVYFLCGLAEKLVSWAMQAIAACSSNAGWGLRVIVQELHGWLRIVVFCIVMSEVLLDEWMASLNVNVPREVQLAGKWIKSAYIILIIVVLKNVGLRVLERLGAPLPPNWALRPMPEVVIIAVPCLQAHPPDGSPWRYSETSRVEVSTKKEFELVATALFNSLSSSGTIAFSDWEALFMGNHHLAVTTYKLMFPMNELHLTETDFVSAICAFGEKRSALAGRLSGFRNLTTLIGTFAGVLLVLVSCLAVAYVFEYNYTGLMVTMSTIFISLSFATSKSISRCVESIIFVFGSQPFTVNDVVIVDGKSYTVHQIGLLETRMRDSSNKIVRFSNQVLCDMSIINQSFSNDRAVSVIATDVAMSTSIDSIEKLRKAILNYVTGNAAHWKPRVTFGWNDISQATSIRLEIKVESCYTLKMVQLKITYRQPPQPVTIDITDHSSSLPSVALLPRTTAK